jgi:hypothetical protein
VHLAERRRVGLVKAAPNLRTLTFGPDWQPTRVQAASAFKQLARIEIYRSGEQLAVEDDAFWSAALNVLKRSQAAGPKTLVRFDYYGKIMGTPFVF